MNFLLFAGLAFLVKKAIDIRMNKKKPLCSDPPWLQATFFHQELDKKITQMHSDKKTTHSDWQELLPVCEYADKWSRATHPHIKDIAGKAARVKEIMKSYAS